jgi:hypothetical protein
MADRWRCPRCLVQPLGGRWNLAVLAELRSHRWKGDGTCAACTSSDAEPEGGGTAVDPGLRVGPTGDRLGDPTSRRPAAGGQNFGWFFVWPATSTAASGSIMSSRSPRNVIVAPVERVPFAAHYEPLPIGREYRFLDAVQLCSGVTLRDLT